MKICPQCQKTYPDDKLNFCLEDGSVLAAAPAEQRPSGFSQQQPQQPQQPNAASNPQAAQPAWNAPQQQMGPPPKKSSKAWIWVLLILVVLVVVCGGGFLAIVAYIGFQAENQSNPVAVNVRTTPSPTADRSPGASDRTDVDKIDLTTWTQVISTFADRDFTDGELTMATKQKGFYYVQLAAPGHTTEDADTRVTVRNVDDVSGRLGYGLVFHSDPQPLQKDYAFLIDTKRKRYRVVYHTPQKETNAVGWTSSSAINGGSEENTLEVRDRDDKIDLYINGKMVKSIKNLYGYKGGAAGLYTSDSVKVAFKDLEIRK